MSLKGGFWREAATVILAAKYKPTSNFNYKVLMLKRSQKSKFLPERIVFPGGVISHADFDPRWHDLFKKVTGQGLFNPGSLFVDRNYKTEMFHVERPQSLLPPQIAFRLCAIRETFEECGILLVTKKSVSKALVTAETKYTLNLANWRRRVNKDAGQLLELCESLKVVPNIWSLYEWASWMTPNSQAIDRPPKRPHRFDTLFYVCCIEELPEARVDKRETTVAQWNTPEELLDNKGARMIEPQLYELAKIENFMKIEELQRYCFTREVQGVQRWMSVINVCSDGLMLVLPGDDLYPDEPDCNGIKTGNVIRTESMQELQDKSQNWNRVLQFGTTDQRLLVKFEQTHGYMNPHDNRNNAIRKANL